MNDAEIPRGWSQLATDIMVSKYFRKAGVPLSDEQGNPQRDEQGNILTGPEKSARQVIHRLAGCWRLWGQQHGYFDTPDDGQAFYDELCHMLLHQMAAPNSPQWFNTGLNFAYGITGPAQGHFICDPATGQSKAAPDAYTHPQPHACFIQSIRDDLVNPGGIMDLWTREARLFKYGSGTGTNFSRLRAESESLSGGGKSSGLMSFLKIGDRAAGAIKSGGTTRRAAKMVCLNIDHPDIESFVNWKVREELKVAAMVEGLKQLHPEQQETARRLGMRLEFDFNGEAYQTVSGQNSNNSIRMPNEFFRKLDEDGDWHLINRTNKKVAKTIKARDLWNEIAYAAWRCADPGVQFDDTINQWHTCAASGRINASNPCVTADTRILTPGGIWRRIDQMIHLPARVVTNLHGQGIAITDGSFPTGRRDVFELRTESGYSLKLTADHKVWTRWRGWVAAADLLPGDELRLPGQPATVQEIGEPADARLFQLLGLYLCEQGGAASVDLSGAGDEADTFARYAAETWGEEPDSTTQSVAPSQNASRAATADAPPRATHRLANRRLISRLGAFVRSDLLNRRLADDAFTAGLPAQKHILRALFTADAEITNDSLELRHSSGGLLEDVQLLLLGFGIKSSRFVVMEPAPAAARASIDPQSDPRIAGGLNSEFELQLKSQGGALGFGELPGRAAASAPTALTVAALRGENAQVAQPGLSAPADDLGAPRGSAVERRHGLRIDPASLRNFATHIGLLRGPKMRLLAELLFGLAERGLSGPADGDAHFDRFALLHFVGRQQVFDLTEPRTHSFVANGLTVHNCSEYMFLDDTACNLASLNVLTFFDPESRRFDIEGFRHAIRLWTIVLEISVLMASFPSEEIARLSYRFRTLGLGFANLGAMLMQAGIAYDSDTGRALCAALSAILTGESYATSAAMAAQLGPFPGFADNRQAMLRVIRNHARAAWNVATNSGAAEFLGPYEGLDIEPVGIDENQFTDTDPLCSRALLDAARQCWDKALALGEAHGYRNAQTTVIAPTGTIGLLMDCDTTGIEPDFALVKFKKLAGGGYFKIANQSLRVALANLNYEPNQIHDILQYVMGTLSLHDAPAINWTSLRAKGFTGEMLESIERSLPAQFELTFAFSPWTLGAQTMLALGVSESLWQKPGFNLLRHLGFTRKQIDHANDVICGRGTIEGAPHLRPEHLPIFDCANRCGKHGKRFINVEGHIRMMAASQPFISGAISKTINLPHEATVEDIKRSYQLSWQLGLKANALYRDGSKLSQPLNSTADVSADDDEEQDADAITAACEEIARDVALAGAAIAGATEASAAPAGNGTAENGNPNQTHVIERIVERVVERPLRRRLPDTRNAITHKFDLAGHEGYITVGLYDDGQPGEMFITMAKEGSTVGGLMDTIATLVSVSLQYGVPVDSLVRKFEHVRFEPAGMTRNPELPVAKSLVDYIFRYLGMQFIEGYRDKNAPRRAKAAEPISPEPPSTEDKQQLPDESRAGDTNGAAPAVSAQHNGNGHGNGHSPTSRGAADALAPRLRSSAVAAVATPSDLPSDPLSRHSSEMQADAPACDVCGSITLRSGTCYKCLNCGNSMGCS
jgi:ribonucleoside-diphosphate reductase alpha chain